MLCKQSIVYLQPRYIQCLLVECKLNKHLYCFLLIDEHIECGIYYLCWDTLLVFNRQQKPSAQRRKNKNKHIIWFSIEDTLVLTLKKTKHNGKRILNNDVLFHILQKLNSGQVMSFWWLTGHCLWSYPDWPCPPLLVTPV